MSASRTVSARSLVAALLASGALVGAAALPASADDGRNGRHHNDRSAVVISDVQHNDNGNGNGRDRFNRNLNAEWVEITNTGRRSVDLDGWTLSDREGNRYRFDDVRLSGRSSVRVHTGIGRDSRRDVYQDRRHQIWERSDTATLRNDRGRVVDSDSWGNRRFR